MSADPNLPDAREEHPDLGFGDIVARTTKKRLLNRDGSFNVERYGLHWRNSLSIYHSALETTWPRFLAFSTLAWLTINLVFTLAYLSLGERTLQLPVGRNRIASTFFFGIQTQSTIGFGHIHPLAWQADVLVTLQAIVGFFFGALLTGLVFARFARPQARLVFSKHAVVAPFEGGQALMFRTSNTRNTQIIDLRARVIAAWRKRDGDEAHRGFAQLDLERTRVAFFPLTWTVVHPITEESPLAGWTSREALENDLEILVLLTGYDDTYAHTVNARTSYKADEIQWSRRFRRILEPPSGSRPLRVNVQRISETEPA